jgi:Domain of unknown function (DUF5011)
MKKVIIYLCTVTLALTIGCTKKNPEVVSKVVNVTAPTITLKGSPLVFVQKGGTYVDSGAVLTDDISGLKSDITPDFNKVDVDKEGWYEVNYKAANSNGFTANVSRFVLVKDYTPSPSLSGNVDLKGTYARTSNGILVNMTKAADGLYLNDNIAGSSLVFPAYIVLVNDSTIDVPLQKYNLVTGKDEIDFDDDLLYQKTNPYAFSFVVLNPSFGTSTRKFVKQ